MPNVEIPCAPAAREAGASAIGLPTVGRCDAEPFWIEPAPRSRKAVGAQGSGRPIPHSSSPAGEGRARVGLFRQSQFRSDLLQHTGEIIAHKIPPRGGWELFQNALDRKSVV